MRPPEAKVLRWQGWSQGVVQGDLSGREDAESLASEGQVQGLGLSRTGPSGWLRHVHGREPGHHLCHLPRSPCSQPPCEEERWREGGKGGVRDGQVRPQTSTSGDQLLNPVRHTHQVPPSSPQQSCRAGASLIRITQRRGERHRKAPSHHQQVAGLDPTSRSPVPAISWDRSWPLSRKSHGASTCGVGGPHGPCF